MSTPEPARALIGAGRHANVVQAAAVLREAGLDTRVFGHGLAEIDHARFDLFVAAEHEDRARQLLRTAGFDERHTEAPYFRWALCDEHPRWTLPCPDCWRM